MPIYSFKDPESKYYEEKPSRTQDVIGLIKSVGAVRQKKRQSEFDQIARQAVLKQMGYEEKERGGLFGLLGGRKLVKTGKVGEAGEGFGFTPTYEYDQDTGSFKAGFKSSALTPDQKITRERQKMRRKAIETVLKGTTPEDLKRLFSADTSNTDLLKLALQEGLTLEDILPKEAEEEEQAATPKERLKKKYGDLF